MIYENSIIDLVRDKNGQPVSFGKTMSSVVNFMAFNGWKLIGKAEAWPSG